MILTPKLPPGRASRKALAYASEIHRLRKVGYSFEAIRLALRDVGVNVSRSTVKREAARAPAHSPSDAPQTVAPAAALTPPVFVSDSRTGQQIAEEFMRTRISNPLVRERMEDEARRD